MAISMSIISKEMIKPSSPTPPHLANLKLSFLDQMAPPNYIPIILFYTPESDNDHARIGSYSHSLKVSLSETLTRFYPLAGRLTDDGLSVSCNDAGVIYVESQVIGQKMSEVIENPIMDELTKFLPINPFDHTANVVLLAIKINFFPCGGLAIAVCMCHKIGDGSSMVSFINSWASQSLGKIEGTLNPDFRLTHKMFPPIDLSGFNSSSGVSQERVITKRLVFDETKLARLKKEMATANVTPTRVEAVSAFIWKKLIDMSKAKRLDNDKIYVGAHAVNLRSRTSPPLTAAIFGNIYCSVTAVSSANDDENLVEKLRNAIRSIDDNYVKRLEDGRGYMEMYKKLNEGFSKGGGNSEFCCFTSWCRLPFYDVDYGWGKPVWVCVTQFPLKNFVVYISTKDGLGIEAWVSLVESDMAVIQAEHSLL